MINILLRIHHKIIFYYLIEFLKLQKLIFVIFEITETNFLISMNLIFSLELINKNITLSKIKVNVVWGQSRHPKVVAC